MSNKDYPAFAQDVAGRRSDDPSLQGLTKREYAAIKIMAGFAADPEFDETTNSIATIAVKWADTLFDRLEEQE